MNRKERDRIETESKWTRWNKSETVAIFNFANPPEAAVELHNIYSALLPFNYYAYVRFSGGRRTRGKANKMLEKRDWHQTTDCYDPEWEFCCLIKRFIGYCDCTKQITAGIQMNRGGYLLLLLVLSTAVVGCKLQCKKTSSTIDSELQLKWWNYCLEFSIPN